MQTLLLRLAGPMQSWGVESKYDERRTLTEPNKSGVLGMIAAALGRSRGDSLDDLLKLRFGVRVDKAGQIERDYQIVHNLNDAKKSKTEEVFLSYGQAYKKNHNSSKETSTLTNRYYIADGIFLVGLESDDEVFLKSIEYALKHPIYHMFLGRRSYPPTLPLVMGIRDFSLEEALEKEPWLVDRENQNQYDGNLRIITETKYGESYHAVQRDVPISFNPQKRMFTYRGLKEKYVKKGIDIKTEHDVFSEVE
ncbi:MAG: type I-E CRISPR-associated protein Cas5/CasD [Eubacteriaceae bacterium]|nr:type I-E CRISPR-associated protein Cas5/CasD [Eubacteriaceae bacterium]